MSTHKHIDRICVAVTALMLLITVLFMNGASLGIEMIIDEDTELHAHTVYFTANDLNSEWNTSGASVITLSGDSGKISGKGAYFYNGDLIISESGKYVISGTLADGSIIVDAHKSSKVWLLLNGVDLNCCRIDGIPVSINPRSLRIDCNQGIGVDHAVIFFDQNCERYLGFCLRRCYLSRRSRGRCRLCRLRSAAGTKRKQHRCNHT